MIDGPRLGADASNATSLVILLHGYGFNGDDPISLARMLQSVPGAAFVAPNAPVHCAGMLDGINGERSGPSR